MNHPCETLKKAVQVAFGDRLERNHLELDVRVSGFSDAYVIRLRRQHSGVLAVDARALDADGAATLERAIDDIGRLIDSMGAAYVGGLK